MPSFRRNKKSINNCPTCGVFVCVGYQNKTSGELDEESLNHQCDPEFIKRSNRVRDAVMDRDYEPRTTRSEAERLAEGFEMLEEDDPSDD
jgi:hypothetical protein